MSELVTRDPAPGCAAAGTDVQVAVVEDVWGEPFEHLAARRSVARLPHAWSEPDRLAERIGGATALVVRNRTQVTRELLAASPSLQVVARAGVGLDNIDLAAADEFGVVVVAPRGANAGSVAEYTLGAALAIARRMTALDRDTRGGGWNRQAGRELAGGTWALLGLGATGREVARLAGALRMRVLAYDPYVTDAVDGVTLAPLDEVVRDADVLSIHLPATAQTNNLVDARLLAKLPAGAIVVNVGRGEVLDEQALADAVASGHLAGAALDVRATEPPVVGRLEQLDNVLFTPHIAGITAQSQRRIAEVLADDIERVLAGESARYAVGAVRRGRGAR